MLVIIVEYHNKLVTKNKSTHPTLNYTTQK